MKPTLPVLLCAALGLAGATLTPLPAAADIFEDFGEGVCKAFGGCDPFGEYVPECVITQVRAFGTAARHSYQFERLCNGVRAAKVSGAYDLGTGRARESITSLAGPPWSLDTSWTCSTDPWIYAGAAPSCTNGKVQTKGQARAYEDYPITFPVSAGGLSDAERHVLDAQLANALAMGKVLSKEKKVGSGGFNTDDQFQEAAPQGSGGGLASVLDAIAAGQGADLSVTDVSGPGALQAGLSGTFTVTIGNAGGVGASVELHIIFAGKLDQTGQVVAGAGLSCELGQDAGINAALKCTGGRLDAGGSASIVVQGRGLSAGAGMLIATLNPSHAVAETNYDNNFRQLNMTVN